MAAVARGLRGDRRRPARRRRVRPLSALRLDAGTRELAPGAVLGGWPRRVLKVRGRLDDPAVLRLLRARGMAHPVPPEHPSRPDLTVVIPCRGREPLLRSTHPTVVVRDDGPDPVGPAGARQQATVTTRFVAFVDADVDVADEVLDRLCWWLDEDPTLGAVAPRIVGARPLDLGPTSGLVQPLSPIAYVPSACLVMRTEVWREHGFDPALRFGEDVDLCWRLLAAGLRTRLDAEAHAHHEPMTKVLQRRHSYGTSAAPLHERHPGAVAPLVVSPLPLAAVLTRSPLVAGFLVGRLAHQLHRAGAPPTAALRLTGEALLATAAGLGAYTSTVAWPLAVWTWPLLPLPHLRDWWRKRPGLDPLTWTVTGLVQDVAYGTGVWRSVLRSRRLGAVLPRRISPRGGAAAAR